MGLSKKFFSVLLLGCVLAFGASVSSLGSEPAYAQSKSKTSARQNQARLMQAIKEGDMDALEAALKAGAKVNKRTKYRNPRGDVTFSEKESPLGFALRYKQSDVVKRLLDAGAKPNSFTGNYNVYRPIHAAAVKDDIASIKALLDAGADIEMLDGSQRTALYLAADYGHAGAVSYLLYRGADVRGGSHSPQERSALHMAALAPSVLACEILLDARAKVDIVRHFYGTPLFWASLNARTPTIWYLVENGADPNRVINQTMILGRYHFNLSSIGVADLWAKKHMGNNPRRYKRYSQIVEFLEANKAPETINEKRAKRRQERSQRHKAREAFWDAYAGEIKTSKQAVEHPEFWATFQDSTQQLVEYLATDEGKELMKSYK